MHKPVYDLRLDIPARAIVNAQLLSLIEHGGTFYEAKKHLFSREGYGPFVEGIYSYRLTDQSLAISLLYCTVVVPREFLNLSSTHQMYSDFDKAGVPQIFDVKKPSSINSYQFLRCLRNSVAHALFEVSQPGSEAHYRFWTERDPEFEAAATHEDVMRLIETVGVRFCNGMLSHKSKVTLMD